MKKTARGFTLVELLVVIAIIAILAAVVVLVINPLELLKRSRDATRLTDLANLQQAINVAVQEATGSTQYLACNGSSNACNGKSTDVSSRVLDGSGWVKVSLNGTNIAVTMPTLPIDPINDITDHYTYCGKGEAWRIETALESAQQKPKMTTDGGPLDTLYEVGSDLTDDATGVTSCAY